MKTLNAVKKLALGVALGGLFALQASATIAYDTSGGTATLGLGIPGNNTTSPTIVANVFNVNAPIKINQLGAYVPTSGTFGSGTVEVAIYIASGANWDIYSPIASFTGTPSGILTGGYAWDWVGPLVLTSGTYAVVAANYGTTSDPYYVGGTQVDPAVNAFFSYGGFRTPGSTLGSTIAASGLHSAPLNAGGNFEYVPEAAGFATAGVGLLGLVYIGRCLPRRKLA